MSWHYKPLCSGYISHTYYLDEKNTIKRELYLHNLVMDKMTFEGKG